MGGMFGDDGDDYGDSSVKSSENNDLFPQKGMNVDPNTNKSLEE